MEANAIGEASEGEVSCDELVPTPPDSPLPSTGAFAPMPSGGPDLDDEFYAIPSGPGEYSKNCSGYERIIGSTTCYHECLKLKRSARRYISLKKFSLLAIRQ